MLEASVPIAKPKTRRARLPSARMAASTPLSQDPNIDGHSNPAFEAEATDPALTEPVAPRRPRKPKARSRSRTPVIEGEQPPSEVQPDLGQTGDQPLDAGQPSEAPPIEGAAPVEQGAAPRRKPKGKGKRKGEFCLSIVPFNLHNGIKFI